MAIKLINPTDKHVGRRVRMRRLTLSMTQEELANQLGITFQQVQKYEKGTNRISASRLQEISHILKVTVTFFFEGAPEVAGRQTKNGDAPSPDYIIDFLASANGHALMKAFARIKDSTIRRSIVRLVEALVRADEA
jgi:transcriptional regulator with XRE-family HTH domain